MLKNQLKGSHPGEFDRSARVQMKSQLTIIGGLLVIAGFLLKLLI